MNNTSISKANELGQNIAAAVLLQQFLKDCENPDNVEAAIALEHMATLLLASQSPAEA